MPRFPTRSQRLRKTPLALARSTALALACSTALAGTLGLAAALTLASPATAATASKPSVSVHGLPVGKIGGQAMPYTETGATAELTVSYKGSLPRGAKLQLLIRKSFTSPYEASKAPIKLVGGSAKVKVSSSGIGGPYSYEVAVVSGSRRLSLSKPAALYWAQPPGGVFVMAGSESAFTSTHVAKENCEAGCKGVASSGENDEFSALAGNSPMPQGWTVTLVFDGEVECTTKEIEGRCAKALAFPEVTAETVVPVEGRITSPLGKTYVAKLLVTVYP
jgi:hypothetical protein